MYKYVQKGKKLTGFPGRGIISIGKIINEGQTYRNVGTQSEKSKG